MAARTVKIRHDDETRAKIQSSQIINRLHDHILNDLDLKPSQVNAALGLLKKTLPDLANVELSSNEDKPLQMVITWQNQNSGS